VAKAPTNPKPLTKHEAAVRFAITQIGVHEQPAGSNTGLEVRKYQKDGSWLPGTGWPWCAAFFNYAVQVGGFQGLDRTAGAWDALTRAEKKGWGLAPKDWAKVIPGDGVVFNTGSGHIAVLEKPVGDDGVVYTIDGNASDMVKRCQRPLSSVRGFVAWPENGTQVASKRGRLVQVVGGESGNRKLVVGPLKVKLSSMDKVT